MGGAFKINLSTKELSFRFDRKSIKTIGYSKVGEKQTFDFFVLAIYKYIKKDSSYVYSHELSKLTSWNMATNSIGKVFSRKFSENDILYTTLIEYEHKTEGWRIKPSEFNLINSPDESELYDYLEEIKTHDNFESLKWIKLILKAIRYYHSGHNSDAMDVLNSVQYKQAYESLILNKIEIAITEYFKVIFGTRVYLDEKKNYQAYYKKYFSGSSPLISSIRNSITTHYQYYKTFSQEENVSKTTINNFIYKADNAIDISSKAKLLNYRAITSIRRGEHKLTIRDAKSGAAYALISNDLCILKSSFCNIGIGYLIAAEHNKEIPKGHIKEYLKLSINISKYYNICGTSVQATLCLALYEMYHCNFVKMDKYLLDVCNLMKNTTDIYEEGLYYRIKAKCEIGKTIYSLSPSEKIKSYTFKKAIDSFLKSANYFKAQGRIKRSDKCLQSAKLLKNGIIPNKFMDKWIVKIINPNLNNIMYK